jgi:hypothetical protein
MALNRSPETIAFQSKIKDYLRMLQTKFGDQPLISSEEADV